MADQTTATTSATVAPAVPTAAQFQANATEAFKSFVASAQTPSAPAAPAAAPAPVAAAPAAPAAAPAEVKADAKPAAPAAKPESKPPSDSIGRSLEKIAAEKAQIRQQQQEIAPYLQLKNVGIDPGTAGVIVRAIQSRDPVSVLTALGFSHEDYVGAVVDGKRPTAPGQPAQAKPQPQGDEALRSEIQALRQQVSQMQIARGREDLSGKIKAQLEGFKYAKGFGDQATQEAVRLLEDYARQTNQLPGATIEESIKIALEAVEENYARQAEQWAKVLTPATAQSTVPVEAPVLPPQVESVGPPKTLTNSLTSPAPASTGGKKRTPEDYQREALAILGNIG